MPTAGTISVENSRRRGAAKRAKMLIHKVVAPALASILQHPPAEPSAFEQAVLDIRADFLAQLGTEPSPAQRALADVVTLDLVVIESLSRYIKRLAQDGGLVNEQERRVFPIVLEADRLSGNFARKLKLFGLKRPQASPQDVFEQHMERWRQSKKKAKPASKSAKGVGRGSRPVSDRSSPKIPTSGG